MAWNQVCVPGGTAKGMNSGPWATPFTSAIWMPKFRNLNPKPVPWELPDELLELAKLALQRMAVDLENKLSVFYVRYFKTVTKAFSLRYPDIWK